MEFPRTDWVIFKAEDFGTAAVRDPGELGVELLAQARPSGRVIDHWSLVIGGSQFLEAELDLRELIPTASDLPELKLTYQLLPAQVEIRRNMTTSTWLDVLDLVRSNNLLLPESDSDISLRDIAETLTNKADKTYGTASIRWAVCVGEAGKLELQLQAISASAKFLGGKPAFKR